jgi:Domain of unknown function (DUF5615)
MPLAYVLDEHLRGLLWRALQTHNAGGLAAVDVTHVGDPPDLPLGSLDPDILLWAERENRIVVTHDGSSMPGHLADHLAAGHRSPGVFIVRRRAKRSDVVFTLALYAHASDPGQWQDLFEWIP